MDSATIETGNIEGQERQSEDDREREYVSLDQVSRRQGSITEDESAP